MSKHENPFIVSTKMDIYQVKRILRDNGWIVYQSTPDRGYDYHVPDVWNWRLEPFTDDPTDKIIELKNKSEDEFLAFVFRNNQFGPLFK